MHIVQMWVSHVPGKPGHVSIFGLGSDSRPYEWNATKGVWMGKDETSPRDFKPPEDAET